MRVTKEVQFDLAHRIPNHKGKCRNLHGHTYKVQVTLDGIVNDEMESPSEGMTIDFKDLKQILDKVIVEPYDHVTMLYIQDPLVPYFIEMKEKFDLNVHFVSYIPTAENMSLRFFDKIQNELNGCDIKVVSVKVWETPTSFAECVEETNND